MKQPITNQKQKLTMLQQLMNGLKQLLQSQPTNDMIKHKVTIDNKSYTVFTKSNKPQ